MTMIAGERAGRGVRAPQLPTPTLPSFQGGACTDRSAAKDWASSAVDNDRIYQRFLASTYCAHCPIAEMCLTQALERGETSGVWGGLVSDELERATYLAKNPQAVQHAEIPKTVSESVVLGVAA